MVIFNNTSADFVLISADVMLKMTTILKELKIAQMCSKNEQTFIKKTLRRLILQVTLGGIQQLHGQNV